MSRCLSLFPKGRSISINQSAFQFKNGEGKRINHLIRGSKSLYYEIKRRSIGQSSITVGRFKN